MKVTLKNKIGCKIKGDFNEKEIRDLNESGYEIVEEIKSKSFLKIREIR